MKRTNKTQYLLRFDDICPTMRWDIWAEIEPILIQRNLKPILAVVPEARKAPAVRLCLEGDISPMAPASILRTHADTSLFLDAESSALLAAHPDPSSLDCARDDPERIRRVEG